MKLHHFKLVPKDHVGKFDVFLDGVKQDCVRRVLTCVEAESVPTVLIEYFIEKMDVMIPEANVIGKVVDDDGETPG